MRIVRRSDRWLEPQWKAKVFVCLSLLVVLTSGCATSDPQVTTDSSNPGARVASLQVVDCLLPGMVRMLGNAQYLTPRRPVRTTAADCSIRGGEYTAYDRADYKSALLVWMPEAEAGNADAQANVGEIFERGLGGEPNYEAAAFWYEKAAKQSNSRAQFNLGTLYEQGLGVQKDRLKALNWYREAWGMPEDSLIYQSVANKEAEELRAELARAVQQRDVRIRKLERDLSDLQKQKQKKQGSGRVELLKLTRPLCNRKSRICACGSMRWRVSAVNPSPDWTVYQKCVNPGRRDRPKRRRVPDAPSNQAT